jgi:glycerol-3-phosphate dehydrogenase subunit B
MTYDTVVVGAGLAGLTAALRLAESGRRVLVVARGVGSTHLAPAAIDVLGYLGEERVASPAAALPGLVAAHPEHPYARVSTELLAASLEWLRERVPGLGYSGGLEENLLLPTAAGVPKPSALVPETTAGGDLRGGGRFVLVGLRGLKDFHAPYAAANLAHAALPVLVSARALELEPPLGRDADLGGLGFARRFEEPELRDWVVGALDGRLEPGERVGFPAVLGLRRAGEVWRELEHRLDRRVFEVPTLPPSVPGMRLFEALKRALQRAGGRLVIGEAAVGAESAGERLEAVVVGTAARPVAHRARSFVLASGGFAAGGLELDSYGAVRETVFGLPVAEGACGSEPQSRRGRPRFAPRYLDPQPLADAGVAVDDLLRPVDADGGAVFENLHAAGAILAGAVPWREQSGHGIGLATGYAAAGAILGQAAVPVLERAP